MEYQKKFSQTKRQGREDGGLDRKKIICKLVQQTSPDAIRKSNQDGWREDR